MLCLLAMHLVEVTFSYTHRWVTNKPASTCLLLGEPECSPNLDQGYVRFPSGFFELSYPTGTVKVSKINYRFVSIYE